MDQGLIFFMEDGALWLWDIETHKQKGCVYLSQFPTAALKVSENYPFIGCDGGHPQLIEIQGD